MPLYERSPFSEWRDFHICFTEHSKGAIKGQLTLDDCGMSMNPEEVEEENPVTAEELGCDPETGEVIEKQPEQKTEHKVISLKAVND